MTAAAAIVPIVPLIKPRRILYPTDFSQGANTALPVLSAIAHHYSSSVLAVHIASPHLYPLATPEAILTLDKKREREARRELAKLVREMESWGVSTTAIVKTGEPVEKLKRIVRDHQVDLAVLSTRGRVGAKRVLMGSVAEMLFRGLSCPVLTVGPHLAARFRDEVEIKNILFATDLSSESRAVFPYLASLAHEYRAKVTLLHVLPPEMKSNPDASVLAEPLRKQMEKIFGPEISPECKTEFVIASGDVAERILEAARDADLIGFGIRKAAAITTHFRNTVVYRVLVDAECPVLTCRQ